MNRIVLYKSSTGFTKQYAEWIAEDLGCNALEFDSANFNTVTIKDYDQVIFGGNIMANKISGLINVVELYPKDLIVFGVGFSERCDKTLNDIKLQNEIATIPFFYFRGGIKYEKLNFVFKRILKSITKQRKSIDYSNRDDIKELVDYVNLKG